MKIKIYKVILVVLFFISFISFIYLFALSLEPTKIIEITNSADSRNDLYFTEVRHFFMIINPPENPTKLKDLMLYYCKENRNIIEELGDINPQKRNIIYYASFYREGWNFPRSWEPDPTSHGSITEQFMDHNKYSLGYVSYSLDDHDNNRIIVWDKKNIYNAFEYELPLSFFNE